MCKLCDKSLSKDFERENEIQDNREAHIKKCNRAHHDTNTEQIYKAKVWPSGCCEVDKLKKKGLKERVLKMTDWLIIITRDGTPGGRIQLGWPPSDADSGRHQPPRKTYILYFGKTSQIFRTRKEKNIYLVSETEMCSLLL